jgi:hypothetical protein
MKELNIPIFFYAVKKFLDLTIQHLKVHTKEWKNTK